MALSLKMLQSAVVDDLVRSLNEWRQTLVDTLTCPSIAKGVAKRGVRLAAGVPVTVPHGFGAVGGWQLTRLQSAATTPVSVHEVSSSKDGLVLVASEACTIDLWVWP